MNFKRRLFGHHTMDGRVIRAQLDFICKDVYSARYTAPVWACIFAFVASSSFGLVSQISTLRCLILVGLVTLVTLLMSFTVRAYTRAARISQDYELMQTWFGRFIGLQVLISFVWGLMPWLLWEPGNVFSHLYIGGLMSGVIATQVIMRVNHFHMCLASLVPVGTLAILRFATGDSTLDHVIAGLLLLYVTQFYIDGKRLTQRISEDARLRFQVEDLARELEETRDEALRKRFEAETANASKTAFLANMSHELRTPLNAILGFSEIIAQECFGPVGSPRYREYASDINISGSHLLSLINDLLDVAKIEAGRMDIEPNPIEVDGLFDSAMKIMGPKSREKNQQLNIRVEEDAPSLFADERALKQILINLLSNAVKFTPEGGTISMVASKAPDGAFQLMVEDNGPGIPLEKLDRIFMPFSQVDNRYDRQSGGTGLGLALVRGLAELHGGRAWLESEPGKGCVAYVVLPSDPTNFPFNADATRAA